MSAVLWITGLALAATPVAGPVPVYQPPAASRPLLAKVDLPAAKPLDEAYRAEFTRCDGLAAQAKGKDTFLGSATPRKCSTDPSIVRALLRLADGGVLWESKMALDVDGSYAATSGRKWRDASGTVRDTTDQCGTSMKWRAVVGSDCADADAQVDPDIYPYAVIPAGGATFLPAAKRDDAKRQFRKATGLAVGDMGVVIVGGAWTPAIIADTGPVYRLGEASSGVFAAVGASRCRGDHVDAKGRCIGDGTDRYPYKDSGIDSGVIFIFYPGTAAGLTRENALARICANARLKLGLTGSRVCPR